MQRKVEEGPHAVSLVVFQEARATGMNAAEAWNHALVEIARASRAHCMYICVKSFAEAVTKVLTISTI